MFIKSLNIDRINIFLAAASGLLLSLSFPKAGLTPLAWVAFIPFFFSIKKSTPGESIFLGIIFGLTHFLTLLYWVIYTLNTYGYLPIFLCIPILFLLAFYLSCYMIVFSWTLTSWCKKPLLLILTAPPLWVCLEYLRSHLLTGFPWELIGYSQHTIVPLIQLSDITGVFGISFLIMLVNTVLFFIILTVSGKTWQGSGISHSTSVAATVVSTFLILACISYGYYRINTIQSLSEASEKATVAVIQGNIDQSLKWDTSYQVSTLKKYNRLSGLSAANSPDLIVWPETAAPFYYNHNTPLTRYVNQNIIKTGSHYLIGSPSFIKIENGYKFYNSAYLITPEAKLSGQYDKVHLVPFGEYVPLQKYLPFVNKLTEQSGDFYSGVKGKTLDMEKLTPGVQICFEMIFPELSREMVKNGATLIVNMTNDAWFGKESAPYQHFSMIKFRAVENRRAVARAANTGISGFVGPTGKVLAATELFVDAYLTQPLPQLKTITFYTKYGDIFAIICFPTLIILLILSRKWSTSVKAAVTSPPQEARKD